MTFEDPDDVAQHVEREEALVGAAVLDDDVQVERPPERLDPEEQVAAVIRQLGVDEVRVEHPQGRPVDSGDGLDGPQPAGSPHR